MMKNESVSMVVRLSIICVVGALCLSLVNGMTAPIIEEKNAIAANEAFLTIFPAAAGFESGSVQPGDETPNVKTISIAKDASGSVLGYCVNVSPSGYGGAISMNVGINPDGTVAGVRIGDNSETAGLGSRVAEPAFYEQFNGVSAPVQAGNQVDAISGSTVSSAAVIKGVNEAAAAVAEN